MSSKPRLTKLQIQQVKGKVSVQEYVTLAECNKQNDVLTAEITANLAKLLRKINMLRELFGEAFVITSGYRSPEHNRSIGGSAKSAHCTGEAIDIQDHNHELADWIVENNLLESFDLYMEARAATPGWCHLSTRKTASGTREFLP